MMPLCTTATRPDSSVCGWALASVAGPWVAQRVWPMPVVPAKRLGSTVGQVAHPAGLLGHPDPAAAQHGDAGRVVAAVLEAGQSLEDDGGRVLAADVADDSAHGGLLRRLSVDDAAQLPLGELGRRHDALAQLLGDAGEDLGVLGAVRLEAGVPVAGRSPPPAGRGRRSRPRSPGPPRQASATWWRRRGRRGRGRAPDEDAAPRALERQLPARYRAEIRHFG